MVLREEPRIALIASFWDSEGDVARFDQETLPKVHALVQSFVEGDVRIRDFDVLAKARSRW